MTSQGSLTGLGAGSFFRKPLWPGPWYSSSLGIVLLEQPGVALLERHGVVLLGQHGKVLLQLHWMIALKQPGEVLLKQFGVLLIKHGGMVLLNQHGMVLLEQHGMVLLEQGGMVLVEHGMVLLEQCVVGLLEHHGTVASGRDSSCPATSQAMHPKPFLAFLTPLGNPSLLEVIPGESSRAPCSTLVTANVRPGHW